jgi:hypothetical protein
MELEETEPSRETKSSPAFKPWAAQRGLAHRIRDGASACRYSIPGAGLAFTAIYSNIARPHPLGARQIRARAV